MNAFRGIYRIWATILTAAVVVQIFFAGYGAFDTVDKVSSNGATVDEDSLETSFGAHIGLGYFIFLGTLVFLLISFGTRDRRRIYRALGVVDWSCCRFSWPGSARACPTSSADCTR